MQTLVFSLILLIASFTSAANLNPDVQKRVQGLMSLTNQAKGLNCWNGALVATGTYPYILHLSSSHAAYIFDHVCTPVNSSIQDAPVGSVVRYQKNGAEIHAFVKVAQDQYFQKFDNFGAYEITTLATIDQTYGPGTCLNKNCDWKSQVLTCGAYAEKIPDEFSGLLYGYSQFLAGLMSAREVGPPLRRLMDQVRTQAVKIIRPLSDHDSKILAYHLIDMSQSNTFLTYGALATNPAELQILMQDVDAFLWEIFAVLLKEKNIDVKELEDVYDFLFFSSKGSDSPETLVSALMNRLGPMQKNQNEQLVLRLSIYSNGNIEFQQASTYVEQAMTVLKSTAEEDLARSLASFFRNSKTFYMQKEAQSLQLVNFLVAQKTFTQRSAEDAIDLVLKSSLASPEKKRIINSIMGRLDLNSQSTIDVMYGPFVRAL